MNINLFKPEDQPSAQKEIDCIIDCSMMLEVHIEKGDFTKVLDLTLDMSKSIVALRKLIEAKETNSQMDSIAAKLANLGIDISIVFKHLDTKKLNDSAKSSAYK